MQKIVDKKLKLPIIILLALKSEGTIMHYKKSYIYRISYLLLLFAILTLLTGCNQKLTDSIAANSKPERVVSLMGSYTDTWILAGGEASLVGITEDVVSERKLQVPANAEIVGTVKEPNLEVILSLAPDFVILSADIESHQQIAETLKTLDIPYSFYSVEYFEDYLSMLKEFTKLTGEKDLYEENGVTVETKIDQLLSKISEVKITEKPSVLFIRAFSSGAKAKAGDNMVGIMLEELGTNNIATKYPSLLEDLSMEQILIEDPDYIFVTTMGDSEAALLALKDGIEQNPSWSSLTAVKNKHYIVLPKELFHYKPNVRWGESYEYLAKILYPELFK